MALDLIVTQDFTPYHEGDIISDSGTIAAVLLSSNAGNVVPFNPSSTGPTIIVPSGTIKFPTSVGDGATDLNPLMAFYEASMAGSGKILQFDSENYAFHSNRAVNGFYWDSPSDAIFTALDKTARAFNLSGNNCGIIGGQIICPKMRRYNVTAVTSDGVHIVFTIDVSGGAHDYIVGDTIYAQNIVTSSGSCNNTPLTVSSVSPTTVTVTSAIAVAAITYPYDRLDGTGVLIYPVIYRSRTQASADSSVLVTASNYLLRDLTISWTASVGVHHEGASFGEERNVVTVETAADGQHFTNLSHNINSVNAKSIRTGDDGISVVGYSKQGGVPYKISFRDPSVRDMYFGGRGLAFVGSSDCKAFGADIDDVYAAGLLVIADSASDTYGNRDLLVDGFKIKSAGRGAASTPTGWVSVSHGAIHMDDGATSATYNARIQVCNGKVLNSRNGGLSGGNGIGMRRGSSIRNVEIEEVQALAGVTAGFGMEDSSLTDFSIRNTTQTGLFTGVTMSGLNEIRGLTVANPNVGTRLWLKTASVASSVLTVRLKPGQTHALTNGSTITIKGVTSGYTTSSGGGSEVAKDFAINAAWTVSSVTPDAVNGDVLTFAAAISDTSHARCNSPEQACPDAYLSLNNNAAGFDGVNIPSFTSGYLMFDGYRLVQGDYAIDRFLEINSTAAARVLLGPNLFSAVAKAMVGDQLQTPNSPLNGFTTISADSNQTITTAAVRGGRVLRTGATAPRTDTLDLGTNIIAGMPGFFQGSLYLFEYWNTTGSVITIGTPGASVVLSGTMTVAANTKVIFSLFAAAGLGSVTFTRIASETIGA